MQFKYTIAEKSLLVVSGLAYLCLGVLKWHYIINPGIEEGHWLLHRYSAEAQLNYNTSYTDSVRYFLLTPKWVSAIIYGNLFLALNLLIIHIVYRKRLYIEFTFFLFFVVSALSVVALATGMLTNTYSSIYPVVARVKELQQSPFTLLFLLVAFKIHQK